MGFFSFLKYTFIIFAAHLATSCGAPFENHCPRTKFTYDSTARCYSNVVTSYFPVPASRFYSRLKQIMDGTVCIMNDTFRYQYNINCEIQGLSETISAISNIGHDDS
jgi:hypothetical protein